jgi:hypothetical protein
LKSIYGKFWFLTLTNSKIINFKNLKIMAGSIITLAAGSKMTKSFRTNYPNATKAVYYTADVYEDLLAQTGCVGIRIYNAINEDGKLTNVMVGVDKDGNDMTTGKVYDDGLRCPTFCSSANTLNS